MEGFHRVFCNNIERLRKERGLSQMELAERMGIGQTRLSRIENGKVEPGLLTLKALADGLGVSPIELLVDPSGSDSGLLEKVARIGSLSGTDQKLVELLIDSFLEKNRLERLQDRRMKDRLEELEKIREKKSN